MASPLLHTPLWHAPTYIAAPAAPQAMKKMATTLGPIKCNLISGSGFSVSRLSLSLVAVNGSAIDLQNAIPNLLTEIK